jgi:hypothetical protein
MAVESTDPELLGVRETARRLSVHENTIRNWARDGVLPTAKIPGSRFHRFDARDVERLRQQRGAAVASVAEGRRTIGPELVDGTQLSQWAATREAQSRFPELVRRLLAATPGISNISIRSGDGVFVGGWDGHAESVGAAYLPSGSLWFEFGVGGKPKTKADEDYEKRRAEPGGAVPQESTFVFMTPRRWSGAKAWADGRRTEGIFADVCALDADDLEGWLQTTPAVHHWISEQLGRRPRDAETLEQWWARFRARTEPRLPAALFLTGRDRERDQILKFLEGPPGAMAVQADWRDDTVAFACAAIDARSEPAASQPGLVVSSSEVWDRTVSHPGHMILVPLFDAPDLASAQQSGHHVVLPLGRDQVAGGAKLVLPRPQRTGAAEALEAAGVRPDRTYALAALARRSMPSLIRKLSRDTRFSRPSWAELPAASVLAPMVLVGGWAPTDGDKHMVSRMVGEPYPTVERTLLYWRNTDDPPFVRPGDQWHLASSDEAFLVLHDALTQADLERWYEIAVEILTEPDPSLDLPSDERPMAGFRGITRTHSPVIRKGVAEGIALVGSLAAEQLGDGGSGTDHSRRITREIFARANRDDLGELWRSLADVLPLLAEATPEVFLDAVHDDLDRDVPVLKTMFQDSDRDSWFHSSSPHTGLLWALETLCWSPEHLLSASRALARLKVVDPGGRLSNRPLQSLESVLVPWIRHTAAPLDLKIGTVESICGDMPDVGWELVLALWPSHHGTAMPPAAPHYRDWSPDTSGVPISEWLDYIDHIVRLGIALAGSDHDRWATLAQRLGPLPPSDRDRVLAALDAFVDQQALTYERSLALWEALRKEIGHHQQFPSAEWSMDTTVLDGMQAIADRLEPTDRVERFAHLFDWRPNLPDVDIRDSEAHEAKLLELRKQAVSETLATGSIDGLRDLAARSPVPGHLGWTVGMVASEELTPELLPWLDAADPKLQAVASSWASQKLARHGASWLREALAQVPTTSAARRTALALCAPPTSEVWDALADIDTGLNDAYWEKMGTWSVEPTDVARAAAELLARHRPWIAVDLLSGTMGREDGGTTAMTPELVMEVLTAAMNADPKEAMRQALGYELGLLLDYLEAKEADPASLAQYEFIFFHLLDDHRTPRALFTALASEPSLFVDLVSRVYRGKNEPERKLDERESALAHHAWWVVRHWRELPGRGESDVVDANHLKKWVDDARLAFAESDRADIGDEVIGQILAASPQGVDGLWPAEPVREIIETLGSPDIESGIHTGVINDRGTTSRGVFDGGKQEWDLAAHYRELSEQTAKGWRRTSRVLRRLGEDYERQARRLDADAAVRADTE